MYKNLSLEELQEKVENGEDIKIVDVREQDEYDEGHIPGAILQPLSELEKGNTGDLEKDQEYHVICRRGRRSQTASEILEDKGFNPVNITAGMSDWEGPVEK